LEPGASQTLAIELKSPVEGKLCHTAKALADGGVKAETEFCTTFSGVSAVQVDMTDTEDPIPVGGGTSYPVAIRNVGTAQVTNLRLKAVIPEGVIFKSAKSPVNHVLGDPLPAAQVLLFEPLPSLEPGGRADYVIFVQGMRPADVRFRVELVADQLEGGPIVLEESTRVYAEEAGPAGLPPIRNISLTKPYRP
jgi:uncharacterized repeat protein (TIGR01451 family)